MPRRRAPGATPATPWPLLVAAATIPATWVPCPGSSVPAPSTHPPGTSSCPTQSTILATGPARPDGYVDAGIDDGDGDASTGRDHAVGAPTAVRPHWRENPGPLTAVWLLAGAAPSVTAARAPRSGRSHSIRRTGDAWGHSRRDRPRLCHRGGRNRAPTGGAGRTPGRRPRRRRLGTPWARAGRSPARITFPPLRS